MIYCPALKSFKFILFGAFLFVLPSYSQIVPDLVIFNANVYTVDVKKPKAEAFAVTENKISAVGSNAEIRKLIAAKTEVMDAEGKLILPGFNDPHVHFFSVGSQFFTPDWREVRTADDIFEKIRLSTRFIPQGEWIKGGFQTNDDSALAKIPQGL